MRYHQTVVENINKVVVIKNIHNRVLTIKRVTFANILREEDNVRVTGLR